MNPATCRSGFARFSGAQSVTRLEIARKKQSEKFAGFRLATTETASAINVGGYFGSRAARRIDGDRRLSILRRAISFIPSATYIFTKTISTRRASNSRASVDLCRG